MKVLKIRAEGLTTSFRYPHFMQGVQPSYEMPPPATLYGHVASALGRWFDPREAMFALRFTYLKRIEDIETTHLLAPKSGNLPGTKLNKSQEGSSNPFRREILFFPRLTLYLTRPDWETAFRSPRYAVVLGRSQDLFTYTVVQVVELEPARQAYLADTLLPYGMARQTGRGRVVLMPRQLDYECNRQPTFNRYLMLQRGVFTTELLELEDTLPVQVWADPTEPPVEGALQGVVFLSWSLNDSGDPTALA